MDNRLTGKAAGLLPSLAALFFLVPLALSATDGRPYPVLGESGKSLDWFVPAGWVVKAEASGDLNGDGRADLAAILQGPKEVWENRNCGPDGHKISGSFPYDPERNEIPYKTIDGIQMQAAEPRILLVLLAQGAGGFRKMLQDNRIILRRREGQMFDPVAKSSLRIHGNNLYLSYFAGSEWRWSTTAGFRLQQGAWRLINYTRHSRSCCGISIAPSTTIRSFPQQNGYGTTDAKAERCSKNRRPTQAAKLGRA